MDIFLIIASLVVIIEGLVICEQHSGLENRKRRIHELEKRYKELVDASWSDFCSLIEGDLGLSLVRRVLEFKAVRDEFSPDGLGPQWIAFYLASYSKDPEVLLFFAKYPWVRVRGVVFRNENTPPEVKDLLMGDEELQGCLEQGHAELAYSEIGGAPDVVLSRAYAQGASEARKYRQGKV